jgi:Uma2 family endonuclease
MATVSLEEQYTAEDLLAMEDGHRYELIHGRLVERAMGAKAGLVAANMIALLRPYVRGKDAGFVFTSDCGYQYIPNELRHVRYPDGSFVRRGRLPNDEPPDGHIRLAPDLAIEVVSPNDLAYEVEEKIEEYLHYGVRLIWLIYPSTQRVHVFRPSNQITRLTPADELSGEDVVPGFACSVADLFQGLSPDTTNHASR